ncbi:hypothetical protein HPP92_000995 [Vanilla planifolia]|uniref:Bidirectional sugar transporter SWEET n=1 Tax=Vanilla planifolia TaxID=51239 RepID=A0A835S1P6_VANPL|nr:hypothetical protein HPP92_000995 [Vanilla planifolia]
MGSKELNLHHTEDKKATLPATSTVLSSSPSSWTLVYKYADLQEQNRVLCFPLLWISSNLLPNDGDRTFYLWDLWKCNCSVLVRITHENVSENYPKEVHRGFLWDTVQYDAVELSAFCLLRNAEGMDSPSFRPTTCWCGPSTAPALCWRPSTSLSSSSTPPKKAKRRMLGLLALLSSVFAAVALVSFFALHGVSRKLLCGFAASIFSICMYASPLSIMRLVIQTKSVEYMPFLLSLFSFLCGSSWFVFGLLGRDPFIIVPNGCGAALGAAQLVLYAIYRNRGEEKVASSGEAMERGDAKTARETDDSNEKGSPNMHV